MSIDLIIGAVAVATMLATVLIKYVTTVRIVRLRDRLKAAEAELRTLQSRLRAVESERALAERSERTLSRKRDRLETQIRNYQQELQNLSR